MFGLRQDEIVSGGPQDERSTRNVVGLRVLHLHIQVQCGPGAGGYIELAYLCMGNQYPTCPKSPNTDSFGINAALAKGAGGSRQGEKRKYR